MDLTQYATLNRKRSILNRKAEPPRARLGRRRVWAILLLIAFSSCFLKDYSVAVSWTIPKLKQYTFHKLDYSFDQFYCVDELWHKESRWNFKAKNPRSSAFGIPQILGLKETDPTKQIDRGLSYIKHRYDDPCKALAHHKIKGWY